MDKVCVGNVVRNIAAMLGFVPVESLVLVLVRGGALDCVLRLDLRDAGGEGAAIELAEVVRCQDADGVVAVIVSEEGATCSICREEMRSLVGAVASELEQRGAQVFGAALVDRVAAGGRWSCLDGCGVGGVLEDPASSVMAAAAVVEGRRMYGTRAELVGSVAVDGQRVAAVAPLLGAGGPVECVAVSVRAAVDVMRRMAGGAVLTDVELAAVATSLVDKRVRDALFNVGDSQDVVAAEALWTVLARVLPSPFRAEALTLLAFSAYLRGEWILAGVALDAVLADDPEHQMAGMLDVALQVGIRPDDLRRRMIAGTPAAVTL